MIKPRLRPAFVSALAFAAVILAVLATGPSSAQTKNDTWPAIAPEELSMKDCPQQPGADAVWLYREIIEDQEEFEERIFKRLKILKESGRDRANIEIPYYSGLKISGLEARHIRPDGRVEPFTGQTFDKTALRFRRLRVSVKTFAIPNVQVGSIIEFRYKLKSDSGGSSGGDNEDLSERLQVSGGHPVEGGMPSRGEALSFEAVHWDLQDDLFTRRAKYELITFPYIGFLFNGLSRVSWVSRKLEPIKPVITKSRVELALEDVPPFEAEEYMTSEAGEQISLDVFYLSAKISDPNEFWKRESVTWQKTAEKFIGDPRKAAIRARELVGGAQDPTERLKKLYEGVQKIRNLSYEKDMTRKQRKEQKIKSNASVADVLENGYGVRSDITRTFVALARAAGLEAEVIRVSNRDDKPFRINLLSFYDQLDAEVAMVRAGDQTLFLDPATPLCPFGLVHWSRSGSAALRYSDKPPAFFMTSAFPPEQALTQREIALKLDPQGQLAGTVKTTFTGHEALVRRLSHLHDDAEARKKDLEKELTDVLPMGSTVSLTGLQNIDNADPVLVASYDVAIPGAAAVAGEKVLMPISLLTGASQYPFRHSERRFSVSFPYPFRELDDIVITLPEGMTLEGQPEGLRKENDFSFFSLASTLENQGRLHIQRDLVIKKSYFPIEQYKSLKSFFDAVRAGDEAQIVLKAVAK